MGITTFIGFIISFGFIVTAMVLGSDIRSFINIPSMILVVGGTVGAAVVNFSISDFLGLFKVLGEIIIGPSYTVSEVLDELTALGFAFKRDGFIGLEREAEGIEDPFLKKGVELLTINVGTDELVDSLNMERENLLEKYTTASGVLSAMGTYAPAFGLIGTLIGLIQMLKTVSNPKNIGPAMALALITTLYGAILSNAVFLPLAGKIERLAKQHDLVMKLVVEGLKSIKRGENPRVMRDRLESFAFQERKAA